MTRINLGRTVFGAAVAVALGVGAQGAMASPATAPAASPICYDDTTCQARCDRLYPGQDRFGSCVRGTCYCLY